MTLSTRVKFTLFATAIMLAVLTFIGYVKLNRIKATSMALSPPFQGQIIEDGEEYVEHAIVVAIQSEGKFYLGREPINSLEVLRGLLLRQFNQRPMDRKVVYIKPADTLKLGESAKVVEIVRSVGAVPKLLRP